MESKTAIQQAIEHLFKMNKDKSAHEIKKFLDIEKEQIEQAYMQGQISIDYIDSGASVIARTHREYYEHTYGQTNND